MARRPAAAGLTKTAPTGLPAPVFRPAGGTSCADRCDRRAWTRQRGRWKSCSGGAGGRAGLGERAEVAALTGLPVTHAEDLEPEATGGGEGRIAAGADAQQQPELRRDESEQAAVGDAGVVRGSVLRAGEMENGIKEQQLDLFADRTATATMPANQLRLNWTVLAARLMEMVRSLALAGAEMAQARFGTNWTRLPKVAAQVEMSVRRTRVSMSSVFPRQARIVHCMSWQRAAESARIAPAP